MNRPANPPSKTNQARKVQHLLDESRNQWEQLLAMVMHKNGIKRVVIDDDDLKMLAAAMPPNDQAFLITRDRHHIPGSRFSLTIAYGEAERAKILAEPPEV